MIFYATLNNPSGTVRSLVSIRRLVLAALGLYPAGCLLRLLLPEALTAQVAGLLMIVGAFVCFALLAGSQINRVTAEPDAKLDEYDRNLRHRAMATAYPMLAVLLVTGIIYLALAASFDWWAPRDYDQWNAMFWGAFLTSSLLPTAALAWQLDASEIETAEGEP